MYHSPRVEIASGRDDGIGMGRWTDLAAGKAWCSRAGAPGKRPIDASLRRCSLSPPSPSLSIISNIGWLGFLRTVPHGPARVLAVERTNGRASFLHSALGAPTPRRTESELTSPSRPCSISHPMIPMRNRQWANQRGASRGMRCAHYQRGGQQRAVWRHPQPQRA